MKSKNVFLGVLISLIVILCSGCATIQHTRKVAEGQIQDSIIVQLDKSKFNSAEKYLQVANEIDMDFRTYHDTIMKWFEQFFPNDENSDFELYENVLNNISINYLGEVSSGRFYFEITFLSIGYFYLFYGVEVADDEELAYEAIMEDIGPFLIDYENLKVEDFSAFSYKYSRTSSDSIYNSVIGETVINGEVTYFEKYASLMESENAENDLLENVEILQVFGTVDDRICSNANSGIEKGDDGLYYHFWNVNKLLEENNNGRIEIFLKTANQSTWYILALIISVIVVVIVYVLSKRVDFSDIDKALTLDYGIKDDEEE